MRSWIILNKKEAEDQFWRYINFPEYQGRSMYEVRIGDEDERDMFVDRWMFQIFYNPIEDKYRIYLNTGNSKSLPHDPDPIITKTLEFIAKIDRYFIDGLDFTDKIYTI